jgi:hypothetical protein
MVPIAVLFVISFPPVSAAYPPCRVGNRLLTTCTPFRSYSATKSWLSSAAWSGAFGSGSLLSLLGHCWVKSEISSKLALLSGSRMLAYPAAVRSNTAAVREAPKWSERIFRTLA